jgi:hypothetical protein
MYNNYDPKKRKLFCFILAILMLVVPVLFTLIWPAVGIIMTLLGVIIFLNWDFITKVAKKLHRLIYKEEMI